MKAKSFAINETQENLNGKKLIIISPPSSHSRYGGHTVGISIYLWLLFLQNSAPDQQKKMLSVELENFTKSTNTSTSFRKPPPQLGEQLSFLSCAQLTLNKRASLPAT